MEKNLDELNENLVNDVQKIKLLLGSDSEDDFIFSHEKEDGLAFYYHGTPNEIRTYAEKSDTFIICLQPYEIAKSDDDSVDWLIGGVAITKPIVNFYFTEDAHVGNEFSSLNTKTGNVILIFAIQIALEVEYNLELKYDDGKNSIGLCVYPEKSTMVPVFLN